MFSTEKKQVLLIWKNADFPNSVCTFAFEGTLNTSSNRGDDRVPLPKCFIKKMLLSQPLVTYLIQLYSHYKRTKR